MAIGDLLGKLKGKEKEEPKKFLALLLTDELVQAGVWQVIGEKTEIVAIGTPVEWDGETGTTNELITAVDATMATATEGIEGEVIEVILGIPYTWTEKNGVLGSKRDLIKALTTELELKALGYIVVSDSVLSHLKAQEGNPATSILVQVNKRDLTVILVKLGRIENTIVAERGEDIAEDIVEAIAQLPNNEHLPSRIILFDSMHSLDEIAQNLMAVEWPKTCNFLHLPKVETLPKDVAIRSLALAGGAEVAKSLGFVAVAEPEQQREESAEIGEEELVSAIEVGFGEEAGEESPKVAPKPPQLKLPRWEMPKLHLHWPKIELGGRMGKPKIWLGLGSGVVVALAVGLMTWLLPSAELTIAVEPKTLEHEVALTLATNLSQVDQDNLSVPAQLTKTTARGSRMIDATGKKIVGEQAKGQVTIYNRTTLPKVFAKGTSLSSGNLKFTLDEEVVVASKSAGADYVDVPGKVNAKVTASAIGEPSNLPANTELTLLNFGKESYVAKNESALTGGTAEEIKVVAKEDQAKLRAELIDELLVQAKVDSQQALAPNEESYLIEDSAKVITENLTPKLGERAETVSGEIELEVSVLTYRTTDVSSLVGSQAEQAIPAGYKLAPLPIEVELTANNVDAEGESVQGIAKVKIALFPDLITPEISKRLARKSVSEVEEVLRQAIPGYRQTQLTITPQWLPPRWKKMPMNPDRITLQLTTSQQ